MPKILVGLSGGVDSVVALMLLKQKGFEPRGVSLKYAVWQDPLNPQRENVCCDAAAFRHAQAVCRKLQVPYEIVDVKREFQQEVIAYFTRTLTQAKTPNPCLVCNRRLKFPYLFKAAQKRKIALVATGHYARVSQNPISQQFELKRARDLRKDQTYSLAYLPREYLAKLVLPLGNLKKAQVYEIARQHKLNFFLKKKESQDFCFVAGKALPRFLAATLGEQAGAIEDEFGRVLGSHVGLHFFTIGQRRGLELPGGPYFVRAKKLRSNTLVVTRDPKRLLAARVQLRACHFFNAQFPRTKIWVQAKTRAGARLAPAEFIPHKGKAGELVFRRCQRAFTPGQFAVFYQNNVCLGGGIIEGGG